MEIQIREARRNEVEELNELAIMSKSIWGYSAEFLERCRPHIRVDDQYLQRWPVRVATLEDRPVGFYSLKVVQGDNRLDNLWIHPDYIKQGIGRKLFRDAIRVAKAMKWQYFRMAGEPESVGFYKKQRASLIGEVPSRLGEGIVLPYLEFQIPFEFEWE